MKFCLILCSIVFLRLNLFASACYTAKLELRVEQNNNNKDSLQIILPNLISCYQQLDSLRLWVLNWRKLSELGNSPQEKIKELDDMFKSSFFRLPESKEESKTLISAYLTRAFYHRQLSNYEAARIDFEKGYQLFNQNDINSEEYDIAEYCLKSLGNIYTRYGDNQKARTTFNKAVEFTKAVDTNQQSLAGYYLNIGITYWNEGDNLEAIEFYNKGLNIKEISNSRKNMLLTRKAQSQFELYKQSKPKSTSREIIITTDADLLEKAVHNLQKASTLSEDSMLLSDINVLLANISLEQGEVKLANQYALKALALTKSQYAKTAREIGKAHNTVGQIKVASQQFPIAIQFFNSALTTVLPNYKPGNIFDLPKANEFYKENTIFEALDGKADALQKLYEVEKDTRLLETALNSHELALNAEQNLRTVYEYESSKLNLQKYTKERTGKAISIAYQLFNLSGKTEFINRAFQLAESSRSVLLLEGIAMNYVLKQLFDEDSLFFKQRDLERKKQSIANGLSIENNSITYQNLQLQFDIIDTKLREINQLIESKHPIYKTIINQAKKQISLNQLDNILTQNETIIEYFQADSTLYAFKIEKDKTPEFYQLKPDLQQLDQLVEILRKPDNSENAIAPFKNLANQLYEDILAPLQIPAGKKIIIIPDGQFNFLPFEVLLTKATQENSFKKLPYLLKDHIVNYQYSATIFARLQQQTNQARLNKVLSIAPVFENTKYTLNVSKEEVNEISKIYPSDVLLRELATKENILNKMDQYNILHFSTHASGEGQLAKEQAHIVLHQDTLYLNEIYQQPIHANLVTLSACETNLGKYEGGEGVMSLSRAFAYAGCPGLVSTLWLTNDQSAKDIMVGFYKNLNKGIAKDKALQQAKWQYLNTKDDAHPFYWAGFVAIGNMQPLKKDSYISWQNYLWLLFPLSLGALFIVRRNMS